MIVSLGMYDIPHASAAYDRLWSLIRAELGTGPKAISRAGDLWADWRSPDLLLSQTCGLPYRALLYDKVNLVGTPDYGLPDCPPGYYQSYILRRSDDPRNLAELAQTGTLAYNEPLSQSGWAAPVAHLAGMGQRPGATLQTGAHLASAHAVAQGTADYASIDAVTYTMWAYSNAYRFERLEIVARTDPTPGLPFITSRTRDPKPIARAVEAAIAALSSDDRKILMLNELVQIPQQAYRNISIPHTP